MEKNKSIEKLLLNKKVSIVAHDSGGAQMLSSFTKIYKGKYFYTATGPALKIFKNQIFNFKNYPVIENINNSDFVITGTGLGSNLEFEAIKYCKKIKKKVYSYLDHWVNYKKRFIRKKKLILPDQIWVGDIDAKNIAIKEFKNISIILIPNPYWIESVNIYKKIKNKKKIKNILFVSSNIDRLKNKRINDLFIFKKFFNYIKNKDFNKIIIRKHPSEINNGFRSKIFYGKNIKFDISQNLTHSFKSCGEIYGHNSMALVIGKLCGLNTYHIDANNRLTIPKKFIDQVI